MKVRNILAGIVFLAANYAIAYPMVGDKVEWTGTVVGTDGTSMDAKGSKEILEQDPTTMKWLVKSWYMVGKWEKMETKYTKKMYTPEKWAMISTHCVAHGGVLEDVTVPAGTYSTCKMTKTHDLMDKDDDDGTTTMWWGDVPFGVVKVMHTGEKGTKTFELSTVTLGQ
ncbi:hypothetical protein [Bdellovibrio bacteriovorus]|uniref:hypothetical protein n=1 Tax=Bdellovibrio bacteriovorus TaxID=959 RepID=UPI00045BED92|nr:hypothetical protein [Bdellovibrio bacteriovorus]AHZ85466.1 hypothetical protein EP01_11025 [Bdellovibrio bacteriovorus]BEV70012.1 hypothetical protein Bb109J_c3432 [Bdellovibrio bacteriovorus]